uniref:SET domain-containing protein n=1 Tax=Oryza brachyantha TaxID=4533 RepID=J3MTF1_ORYBR
MSRCHRASKGEVAVAAVAGEGGTSPRRSFRIKLRPHVRVVPWVKSPVARRKPKDPAKPPPPSIKALAAEWAKEKAAASGAPEEECVLPFLQKGAPRKKETRLSAWFVQKVFRVVTRCVVQFVVAMQSCIRLVLKKVMDAVLDISNGAHPTQLDLMVGNDLDADPIDDIEAAFRRLPLPSTFQEFNIDPVKKEELDNNGTEPLPSLFVSCSRACDCSDKCTNKPFRREKKIEIVKTQNCGWGARALEAIEKDDFVIEFVGEVIDDKACEERLEDMRKRGDKNFYMCKVKKDFVIDATFKGNDCRFFNHSCEPNCQLQKWQVNGKTRLGVFASKAIEVGEPLTYDYRFEQHYGPEIECFCGSKNCQGSLSVSSKD